MRFLTTKIYYMKQSDRILLLILIAIILLAHTKLHM